jgi:hypothetical protein
MNNDIKDDNVIEYYFCNSCLTMLDKNEILPGKDHTLACSRCGSSDIGEPAWVNCPYLKMTAVKCPRGGKGITRNNQGVECSDRCFFRQHHS